jgi:hypothetical protein
MVAVGSDLKAGPEVVRKMVSREEVSCLLVRFMGRMWGIVSGSVGFCCSCFCCLVFCVCCEVWCVWGNTFCVWFTVIRYIRTCGKWLQLAAIINKVGLLIRGRIEIR